MAEISLKIKSDFEQAQAAFKSLGTLSESAQKQLAKLQAQMEKGSEARFTEKNKFNAFKILDLPESFLPEKIFRSLIVLR